jgi:hypothetical protein
MFALTKITATGPEALSMRFDLRPDGLLQKTTAAALSQDTDPGIERRPARSLS